MLQVTLIRHTIRRQGAMIASPVSWIRKASFAITGRMIRRLADLAQRSIGSYARFGFTPKPVASRQPIGSREIQGASNH